MGVRKRGWHFDPETRQVLAQIQVLDSSLHRGRFLFVLIGTYRGLF